MSNTQVNPVFSSILATIGGPSTDLVLAVDQLGALDSQIKALTKQLDKIKDAIKSQGVGDFAGFAWNAKVSNVNPADRIDWQSIALKFEPSRQLISAYTTKTVETKRIAFSLIK